VARVSTSIVVDSDVRVAGVEVEPGGELVFDPDESRTLTSTGNVVIHGRLRMRPSGPGVVHRVVFEGVDEGRFEGGGEEVLDSDVGLWVMHEGVLDIRGSKRTPWARAEGPESLGATTLMLDRDVVGWRAGDSIAITPTASPADGMPTESYDLLTVAEIQGRSVELSGPTAWDHPVVDVGGGSSYAAEVLNLTRNVRIEGTAEGRSHVFVHGSEPQTIAYVALRYLGPRRSDAFGDFVHGRYGLHIHMCFDGSRGSVVTGVVATEIGSHAFVAHNSHGVTFRRCVSHDTREIPYWWDDEGDSRSNDITYDRCVASFARSDSTAFRLSGFFMGGGEGNVARGCVAVGIGGVKNASGYFWPGARSEGVWVFEDDLAHNCDVDGIFTWQNTDRVHHVDRFVAYHNGGAGIEHGAYRNPYRYTDSILFGNARAAVQIHAAARPSRAGSSMRFVNVICDGAGLSDFGLMTEPKVQPPDLPTEVTRCTFRRFRRAAIGFVDGGSRHPDVFDIVDCDFDGNEFWLEPDIDEASVIRVQDEVHGSIQLRRADQAGDLNDAWNARVTDIPPFD
jgi:hypothetical protein